MSANTPLPEPRETFARLLARGSDPATAYNESRIGVTEECTVDQAKKLPGVWARVEWLKRTMADMPRPARIEDGLTAKTITNEHVIDLLIADHALACQMGQVSAAAKCAELIGKEKGMFVERSNVQVDIRHMIALRLDEAIKRVDAVPALTLPSK